MIKAGEWTALMWVTRDEMWCMSCTAVCCGVYRMEQFWFTQWNMACTCTLSDLHVRKDVVSALRRWLYQTPDRSVSTVSTGWKLTHPVNWWVCKTAVTKYVIGDDNDLHRNWFLKLIYGEIKLQFLSVHYAIHSLFLFILFYFFSFFISF